MCKCWGQNATAEALETMEVSQITIDDLAKLLAATKTELYEVVIWGLHYASERLEIETGKALAYKQFTKEQAQAVLAEAIKC